MILVSQRPRHELSDVPHPCCTFRKLQMLQLFVASGMTMLIISCIFVARAYQILVDNMCLITSRDSVSDQATETWSGYWKGTVRTTFPGNLSPAFLCDTKLKRQTFTENIWAHWQFCHPEILQFLKSNLSLNNEPKESFASLSLCYSASFVLSRSPVVLFSAFALNWLCGSLYETTRAREP